jgi:hypothetical protein
LKYALLRHGRFGSDEKKNYQGKDLATNRCKPLPSDGAANFAAEDFSRID